jgi:hypothetical protein
MSARARPGSWANVAALFAGTNTEPLTDTYIGARTGTVAGLTFTFPSINLGAADDRLHCLLFFVGNANTHKHLSVSGISGGGTINFTNLAGIGTVVDTANANYVSAWIAPTPLGGTLSSITITNDVAPVRMGMQAYTHGRGATVSGTPIKAFSASAAGVTVGGTMDIAAGGFAVAFSSTTAGAGSSSTWTGVTETHDAIVSSALFTSGGMYSNTGGAEVARTINDLWSINPSTNVRFIAVGFPAKITAAAPVNTVLPALSGSVSPGTLGDTLSVSNGTWNNTPTSYTYQWFKLVPVTSGGTLVTDAGDPVYSGAKINIGTGTNSFLLAAASSSYLVGCTVTATNSFGSTSADTPLFGIIP